VIDAGVDQIDVLLLHARVIDEPGSAGAGQIACEV
jgi:hypothetical protein